MSQLPTVLVGISMHPEAAAHLAGAARVRPLPTDADQLAVIMPTANGIITYVPSFDPALLATAQKLKVIACHACHPPQREVLRARGISVTVVPSLWDTVADLTLALMFATARMVPQADRAIKDGQWGTGDLKVRFSGRDLFGKTLGIVGLGKIGLALAKRVQGFDMRMLYADTIHKPEREQALHLEHTSLHTLLAQADVIALTLPLNAETRGLIGAAELRLMKPDAILVNTARGAIIDEQALVQALQERWFAGAGLDVFVEEPLKPNHPCSRSTMSCSRPT